MIDFKNSAFFKLKKVDSSLAEDMISPMLISGETIVSTYKGLRDMIVFTNKRIVAINIQGVSGKKQDYTSMPYSKIQVYSVETAGWATSDLVKDTELELYFSSVGKVKFEFTANSDVKEICRVISEYVL